eukprot:12325697-Alexandrium_andersonii.AAC.1
MDEKSGLELWRRLTAEYDPNAGDRVLGRLRQILRGDVLKSATVNTFEEKLLSWERLVGKHE